MNSGSALPHRLRLKLALRLQKDGPRPRKPKHAYSDICSCSSVTAFWVLQTNKAMHDSIFGILSRWGTILSAA